LPILIDFGSKWTEQALEEVEDERKRRALSEQQQHAQSGGADKCDECSPPPTKQRKCETQLGDELNQQTQPEAGSDEKISTTKEPEISEGTKLVPGMNGLSVFFVKESLYSSTKLHFDENICSVHLPRGRYVSTTTTFSFNMSSSHLPPNAKHNRVHRLLLALINIFRLNHRSKNDLLREISSGFPHYKTSAPALYRWYINMCMQIIHLVPTLEGPIVNLLVEQALEMDVQIKINDKGGVFLDEIDDDIDHGDFSKKRSFQIISQDNTPAKETAAASHIQFVREDSDHITEIAERLDFLMTTLCQRIHKLTSFQSDSLAEALAAVVNSRRLYRHLNDFFDSKVRTTDRAKFCPFVFFVLFGREHDALDAVGRLMAERKGETQSSNAVFQDGIGAETDMISAPLNHTDFLYRGFCAKLIDLFYNPVDAGDVPSQTVVCTLASLVSRASYVCPETVCECLAAILQWAEVYLKTYAEQRSGASPALLRRQSSSGMGVTQRPREIHALFYTACQAAFYIMCFRGAEALHYYHEAYEHRNDEDSQFAAFDSVDLDPKRWKMICNHPLQPLRHCLESVRVKILHVAEDLDLFLDPFKIPTESKEEEAKQFVEQLWSTNCQGKPNYCVEKPTTVKRKRSSIISTAGGLGKESNPLDSYFPFDPYLLQESYPFVHPYCRNWEDCIPSIEDIVKDTAAEGSEEADTNVCIHDGTKDELIFQDVDVDEDDDNTAFTNKSRRPDDRRQHAHGVQTKILHFTSRRQWFWF
jgi:hypothetical protein